MSFGRCSLPAKCASDNIMPAGVLPYLLHPEPEIDRVGVFTSKCCRSRNSRSVIRSFIDVTCEEKGLFTIEAKLFICAHNMAPEFGVASVTIKFTERGVFPGKAKIRNVWRSPLSNTQ